MDVKTKPLETDILEMAIAAIDKSDETSLQLVDKYLKLLLGNNLYYDYRSVVVREAMKEIVEDNMNPEFDVYETPDNKALESAAAYRMLKYFSTPSEYKTYVEALRDEQEED